VGRNIQYPTPNIQPPISETFSQHDWMLDVLPLCIHRHFLRRIVYMSAATAPNEQAGHFLALLKKFQTAMLVTQSGGGGFHARPMAIAKVEDDGRLWFITGADTAKVHEIEVDSHVHLIAQDGNTAFLSLSGRASLIDDREKLAQLWQESFREWFPKGKDDSGIELIAVRPERGEFWDSTGAKRFKYLWEGFAKAHQVGGAQDTGDNIMHGTVRM
jgi:general stress protein 26